METVFYTGANYNKEKMSLHVCVKTHGMARTHPHNIWRGIKGRCLNLNHPRYLNYGGRGIGVCEKWLTFEGFFEDMGYFDNTVEIDRIDNNGGYCKENCRLVTSSVNSANRSSPRKSMLRGVYRQHGKFRSIMRVNGINYHLGYFLTENEAHLEYLKNAKEWWGERSVV